MVAAAALLPLLAGCVSEKREQELGDQIAIQINNQIPLVSDGPLNHYVTDLGRMLARRSERPDVPYRFYIVDTEGVNAFALPGGHIYVNRGLIERTRNVSELAGVLAHEIGHVAARHGAKNLQRQMRTRSMSGILYKVILNREPILDQEALDIGGAVWSAAHSRNDEQEADRLAVGYLIASGVDPNGMLSLFNGFVKEEAAVPQGVMAQWFSTHPASKQRLKITRAEIQERMPATRQRLATQVPSYDDFLRRLHELPPAPPMLHPGAMGPNGQHPFGGK
ncbi:MAG: Putative Zn-dependent protease [uncultured Gemmatimonadetes bacterium]|uniref:Zn-dependent protease n=1 Tax=uncultured Gemmatimonadota bacterium TaxID=203437 RepID=A0A6J4MW35_9BACT|nr:MAG: Putative Zn-dependent protease [uncultured Gemmatimonadota bacterium]